MSTPITCYPGASTLLDPSSPDTWPQGILAAADLREARAKASTPGPYMARTADESAEGGDESAHQIHAGRDCAVWLYIGYAAHDRDDADHIAAEANPAHALAAVRHWRSVAERHVCGPIWSRGCQKCRQVWPCDDLTEVADDARAYLGGTA